MKPQFELFFLAIYSLTSCLMLLSCRPVSKRGKASVIFYMNFSLFFTIRLLKMGTKGRGPVLISCNKLSKREKFLPQIDSDVPLLR